MKVLIACEFSGIVRDAFLEKGHDAWSCDIRTNRSESDGDKTMKFRVNRHHKCQALHHSSFLSYVRIWDLWANTVYRPVRITYYFGSQQITLGKIGDWS